MKVVFTRSYARKAGGGGVEWQSRWERRGAARADARDHVRPAWLPNKCQCPTTTGTAEAAVLDGFSSRLHGLWLGLWLKPACRLPPAVYRLPSTVYRLLAYGFLASIALMTLELIMKCA